MSCKESIDLNLQQKFQTEQLIRIIYACEDVGMLRDIAVELVKLNQKKTAIANFSARMACKTEQLKLNKKM
ncbi:MULTISPECIES: hypothetical protein [Prochlorococcus]|uniref:hypothetical protein n=1 Tax=Prochlorococcus TaxID=1218 RepID=UPI0005338999|nr:MULTISPECIES: hypothetical protein [Prochlorococcus]KGG13328.1 hypothetical protein EV05_1008 [Prochlorococcus sp. MIT 0601]